MDEKLLLKPPCPSTTHESSEASGGSPTTSRPSKIQPLVHWPSLLAPPSRSNVDDHFERDDNDNAHQTSLLVDTTNTDTLPQAFGICRK